MTCTFCQNRIAPGESRCRVCGRRPDDSLNAGLALHHTSGALASAPQMIVRETHVQKPPEPADFANARQGSLFQFSNVIPIESYAPKPAVRSEKPRQPHAGPKTGQERPAKTQEKRSRVSEDQGELPLLPPATPRKRTLGTSVEAVIYSDLPVASSAHRAIAFVLDAGVVLFAYTFFLAGFYAITGGVELNKPNVLALGGMLAVFTLAYGLAFAMAGTVSAGMQWMHLRLVDFDGEEPLVRQRISRFFETWLCFCTVVGLLWSLADEENLTWSDHMSHTFPTPCGADEQVFCRRRV
jgi:uncharacterized RDD family membrane protein YckC